MRIAITQIAEEGKYVRVVELSGRSLFAIAVVGKYVQVVELSGRTLSARAEG